MVYNEKEKVEVVVCASLRSSFPAQRWRAVREVRHGNFQTILSPVPGGIWAGPAALPCVVNTACGRTCPCFFRLSRLHLRD